MDKTPMIVAERLEPEYVFSVIHDTEQGWREFSLFWDWDGAVSFAQEQFNSVNPNGGMKPAILDDHGEAYIIDYGKRGTISVIKKEVH